MNLKAFLKDNRLMIDGAFGTYYNNLFDTNELPEFANITNKDRVINIHKEYIEAGAKLIRTNTFACNSISLDTSIDRVKDYIRAAISNARTAIKLAKKEANKEDELGDSDTFLAASIGPIPFSDLMDREMLTKEYLEIVSAFIEEGVEIFDFETFDSLDYIMEAIKLASKHGEVLVSFSVNQYGYSNAGLSARHLLEDANNCEDIFATGFNCGVGPSHMEAIIKKLSYMITKPLITVPNVGYPSNVSGRMVFLNQNVDYFKERIDNLLDCGVDIIGGCCGTNPKHIKAIAKDFDFKGKVRNNDNKVKETRKEAVTDAAFYNKPNQASGKLIAVELAPPLNGDDEKLISSALYLKNKGVDVLTFPDSPSGRTRADSILVANKVNIETGMCVMPHICCRDKNAIAIRSQLLGAYVNDIKNFLVITGDPIPSIVRSSVKSVFNFDSVGLMNIIKDMNYDQFNQSQMVFGGAINQGRSNFKVELNRVLKKLEAGATFFFTQPIFSKEDIDRLRTIKEAVGDRAKILAGIMPLVSLKNASFMKNEMAGINVTDEIISMYREDMTKEEGEEVGIKVAKSVISQTKDFIDGYYFSFPFNRVYLLDRIVSDEL